MTDQRISELREKAAKARQLARYSAGNERLVANLEDYAEQLEEEARRLEETKEVAPLSPQAMEATHEPPTNQ